MPRERWRSVVGYEGKYWVSSHGYIWSELTQRLFKLVKDRNGYVATKFSTGEKYYNKDRRGRRTRSKHHFVHRLVMAAFVGPCPEGQEVMHNNHIRSDNRLENLRYGTHVENMAEIDLNDEVAECPF